MATDEHRRARRTPHARDAAGAARNLGAIHPGLCVPAVVPLPTAASSARNVHVRRAYPRLFLPDPMCRAVMTAPKKARSADRPDRGRTPVRNGDDGSRMRRRAKRPDQGRTPVRDSDDGSRMRRRAKRLDRGRTTQGYI
jgi:hypothetical protein